MDPRIRERRDDVQRQEYRRRIRALIVAGAVIGIALLALIVLYSPLMSASRLLVTGQSPLSENTVLHAGGISNGEPLIDISAATSSKGIEKLPSVADAVVSIGWPDTVRISVRLRSPFAYLQDANQFAVVDRTGRIIATDLQAPTGLIELVGVAQVPDAGSCLSGSGRVGVEVAQKIPASLSGLVTEVQVDNSSDVTIDLQGQVSAVLGQPDELQQKFEALATLMAKAPPSGPSVVDVTIPTAMTVTPGVVGSTGPS